MQVGCKLWPQLSLLLLGLAASFASGEEPLRKQALAKFELLETVPAEKLEAAGGLAESADYSPVACPR